MARLPSEVDWKILLGAACLCGIGFTMSLFVADLAFGSADEEDLLTEAKIGILLASVIAGATTPDQVRSDFNATATGYQFIKYVNPEDKNDRANSGVDFILMRYADVLLMWAEAKIELNQIDQSVYDAINAVRTRAGPQPCGGPDVLVVHPVEVVVERAVEPREDGHRGGDVARLCRGRGVRLVRVRAAGATRRGGVGAGVGGDHGYFLSTGPPQ